MLPRKIFIIILQITAIQMYRHHKPLTEKVWSERCIKNSIVLNDCNWCRCNTKQKYDCKARVCEEIDMFGHFKDAIQEIDVGMEGHGSWRSKPSSCTPGVHYRRGVVLCVCDEDGNWPNPVCRDLFQVLHSVEATGQTRLSKNESCTPTKLYLVGCNVCFCPSSGYLDPNLCTDKECQEDDPIMESNDTMPLLKVPPKRDNDEEVLEIYAMCDQKYKYELGCRYCDCLRNNRLVCDNCIGKEKQHSNTLDDRSEKRKLENLCNKTRPLKIFSIGCNLCHCSRSLNLFCTIRKCINYKSQKLKSSFKFIFNKNKLKHVDEPPDDGSCVQGTTFNRDCNTCVCGNLGNGVKAITCTRSICSKNPIEIQKNDCVTDTFYEENCMICHCYVEHKIKYRTCRLNTECIKNNAFGGQTLSRNLADVSSLRGYCVPMQKYKNDCNICRCLTDGKSIECSSKTCSHKSDALSVDIVPVEMEFGEDCPKGHSYQLDCNLCFCLSNGNAICTTNICFNHNKISN